MLGSDDFPVPVRAGRRAARDLTAAAAAGALAVATGARHPLAGIARAHGQVDAGPRGRVLADIPR